MSTSSQTSEIGRCFRARFGMGFACAPHVYGSGCRVRPANFEQFVADVRGQTRNRPPFEHQVTTGNVLDLEEEICLG